MSSTNNKAISPETSRNSDSSDTDSDCVSETSEAVDLRREGPLTENEVKYIHKRVKVMFAGDEKEDCNFILDKLSMENVNSLSEMEKEQLGEKFRKKMEMEEKKRQALVEERKLLDQRRECLEKKLVELRSLKNMARQAMDICDRAVLDCEDDSFDEHKLENMKLLMETMHNHMKKSGAKKKKT